MFKNIFTKTLFEKRWMIIAWSLGLAATAALTMAFYDSFSQVGTDEFIESIPDSLKALVGSVESFKTIPGYVAQQIYGPQIPIMSLVLAIILYIGIGVGEEDRGTLQTLMAQPVTRTQIYVQKLYAGMIILTLVSIAVGLGVVIGVVGLGETMSYTRLLQATIMMSLLNISYGVIAYAVGMGTGKKGLAIGLASGYAFISIFLSSLAPAVKVLQPFEKFSLFYYYSKPEVFVHGIDMSNLMVILAVTVVVIGIGLLGYLRRDIDV